MTACWAVVPAAGSGSRAGATERKQFLQLEGRSLLSWSLRALLDAVPLAGIMVALPRDTELPDDCKEIGARVATCVGGASRAASVAAGLAALAGAADDWVLVHDAARPCVPAADVQGLVQSVTRSGVGAILAHPVTDTLKRTDDAGRVAATVDRGQLWRALTPQMFRVGELRAALADALACAAPVTDEASAMERVGYPVGLVEGSAVNIKVTYPDDFALARFWLTQRTEAA